ncbi:hypothetical protein OCU04_006742 [Sclerotinia nivalis]|uniref:Pesticidal crystal protein cry6Aa n=1 Tax=Sclerotinia nivalis TaxID=352851 RepID=A0A9X0AKC8_9HELO|nr:hypothetical protein OCU04_006742 [Sclerotinia nivalis]
MSGITDDPALLTPKGLFDTDGRYLLTQSPVSTILKFVHTGAFLSTTKEDYLDKTGIPDDQYAGLAEYIDPLLQDYAPCKEHCVTFRDVTYPSVVALADAVYSYAQKAGGKEAGSYYANIIKYGKALFDELQKPLDQQDAAVIAKDKEIVSELVDNQVTGIGQLQDAAKKATQDMKDFETNLQKNKSTLDARNNDITQKLSGEGGEMAQLQAEIATTKDEINADQSEYEHDRVVAATAATYAWVFPIGTIAAATVIAIYVIQANKIKAEIGVLQDDLKNDEEKLAADNLLCSDLGLVQADLKTVLDMISPAIAAIETLIGAWDAIASDLTAVKDAVNNESATELPVIQQIDQDAIIGQWDDLKAEVDKYRLFAYVESPPTQMSADEWIRQVNTELEKK